MLGSSFLLAALGLTGAAWIRREKRDAWAWAGTAAGCLAIAILTGPATVEECNADKGTTALSEIHASGVAAQRDQIGEARMS